MILSESSKINFCGKNFIKIELPNDFDDRTYLFKNLRVMSNIDNVERIEWYIGGQRLIMVFMDFLETLQKFHNIKDKTHIPITKHGMLSHKYHHSMLYIYLKTKGECSSSY